jgi:excisionase family DNA binding protein
MMEKLTMSVSEVAKTIGISLPKAYELTARQGFPSIHIGRRIVVPVAALEEWLASQTKTQAK